MSAPHWIARWAAGDPQLSALFPAPPFDPMRVVAQREVGAWTPLSADDIAEWRAFLTAHGASHMTLSTLEQLSDPRALAVVTGQQAGFALGPLYVIFKALTALHFANRIARETGRPCVPIFWVASDDHDIDEVAEVNWVDDSGRLRKDKAASSATASAPAYEAPISEGEVARLIHAMAADLPEETRARFADAILAATAPPATFESQFVRHFLRLFGALGIVPIVPRLGFLRARGAALVDREIARPRAASDSLARENERLRREFGFETIHRAGDELNFFLECGVPGEVRRCKLAWEGDHIVVTDPRDGTSILTPDQVRQILRDTPARFSPNAAMRPLVQDLALPTIAYVGGPAECAYHAQIGPLYAAFGVTRPAIIPRASAVILDKQATRSLAKLGIDAAAAAACSREALEALLKSDADGEMPALSPLLEGALKTWADALGEESSDPQVAQGLAKTRENILFAAKKLEERADSARARREGTRESHVRRVVDAMFPGGVPQERVVNAHFAMAKIGGDDALEQMMATLNYDSASTQPIAL
jgi:bacillithiol biosynthesis cysteine-adding enzyme BshC